VSSARRFEKLSAFTFKDNQRETSSDDPLLMNAPSSLKIHQTTQPTTQNQIKKHLIANNTGARPSSFEV
jgi:hypothetical protein